MLAMPWGHILSRGVIIVSGAIEEAFFFFIFLKPHSHWALSSENTPDSAQRIIFDDKNKTRNLRRCEQEIKTQVLGCEAQS